MAGIFFSHLFQIVTSGWALLLRRSGTCEISQRVRSDKELIQFELQLIQSCLYLFIFFTTSPCQQLLFTHIFEGIFFLLV